MGNSVMVTGLSFNLVAAFLIAYERKFHSKETIRNESKLKENATYTKKSRD